MFKKLKNFWNDPFGVETLKDEVFCLQNFTKSKFEELEKHNRHDVDISYRGRCTVVLTGVYRSKGFVSFYDVEMDEFKYFVEHFRGRKNLIRNIDDPLHFYRGSFEL